MQRSKSLAVSGAEKLPPPHFKINQLLLFLILFLLPSVIPAQKFVKSSAFSPDLAINFKLNEDYFLNTKIEAFHYFVERDVNDSPIWVSNFDGTDFQLFLTKRLNPYNRVSLGYQYGFEPNDPGSHRIIQQFSTISRPRNLTIGHRLRSDQTFYQEESFKLRLRYRFSLEVPLQGQALDPGEFFLLASEEVLFDYQDSTVGFENRLVFNIGYMIKPSQKLQFGFDLRSENGQLFTNNTLLVKLGWIVNL
ncbi:MAG: DUF2490 domain-containing protein [Bacteroidales bacterium]|nr:DUF2490 domain-containing protein [Bacteroidales bacterium]